jgi:N-methylhydantoinase A
VRGGTEATVTDANLILGYLEDGALLGGEIAIQKGRSAAVLEGLGKAAGLDPLAAARGIVQVANTEMGRALRVISVERGLDPRDFALVAFGGAGPMHACALAEDLGPKTVLVPKASGVLSALGLAVSDVRRDYMAPFMARLDEVNAGELEDGFERLEATARRDLGAPHIVRRADLRYTGQSFELTVDADGPSLNSGFESVHERRYGYVLEGAPVEVVNLRVVATIPVTKPSLEEPPDQDRGPVGTRRADFDGGWSTVPVFDRTAMGAGAKLEGPALVDFPDATCVVRPGWSGVIDEVGTLVLERGRE